MDALIHQSIRLNSHVKHGTDWLATTTTTTTTAGMQDIICTKGHGNFRCSLFPYDPRHPMQALANSHVHSHSLMWMCDRIGGDELESVRLRIELYNAHWRKRLMDELFMPQQQPVDRIAAIPANYYPRLRIFCC
jgi:hypothetical protein